MKAPPSRAARAGVVRHTAPVQPRDNRRGRYRHVPRARLQAHGTSTRREAPTRRCFRAPCRVGYTSPVVGLAGLPAERSKGVVRGYGETGSAAKWRHVVVSGHG